MSDEKNNDISVLASYLDGIRPLIKEHNKQARKRNRLAKRQYKQSVLNYEQVERQYLIEKSRLQPTFKLTVTEFLTCEPDFVNDPEQAGEAKFLVEHGFDNDQRMLRIKVQIKGDAEYMQPSIVIPRLNSDDSDERVIAMSDLLYFVPVNVVADDDSPHINVFFVYRDKTTLPVVHKYRFVKRYDSALLRWDVSLMDTMFVSSHKHLDDLHYSTKCSEFFINRD